MGRPSGAHVERPRAVGHSPISNDGIPETRAPLSASPSVIGKCMAADTWVEAVIEIPRGSRNKYELDEATGIIRLDRVLYSSVHYPADYGFIIDTYAPDGDPLDILVLVEDPTFPGCHVHARPIGVMCLRDEKGADDKI